MNIIFHLGQKQIILEIILEKNFSEPILMGIQIML